MGRLGGQSQGEILPADQDGEGAVQGRGGELVAHLGGHQPVAGGHLVMRRLARALRNLFSRRAVERDLEGELDAYQDLLVAEKIAAGMTPEAARRSAPR